MAGVGGKKSNLKKMGWGGRGMGVSSRVRPTDKKKKVHMKVGIPYI